jgi:hypothetical protein
MSVFILHVAGQGGPTLVQVNDPDVSGSARQDEDDPLGSFKEHGHTKVLAGPRSEPAAGRILH